MKKIVIGRSQDCDYVIIDPEKRVSRKHLELIQELNHYYIKDLGSVNGTFVNKKQIAANVQIAVNLTDNVSLSNSYPINLSEILGLDSKDSEKTMIFSTKSGQISIAQENDRTVIFEGGKKTVFQKDKVNLDELSEIDKSPYKTIGRVVGNHIVINKSTVSRQHCQIRLISPMIIEIEDLGSSNGTFADGKKLTSNKKYRFSSGVKVGLGTETTLDLKKIFKEIVIVPKTNVPKQEASAGSKGITVHEKNAFFELEEVWNEFYERQNSINNIGGKFSIAGSIAGGLGSLVFGGPVGMAVSIGGGIIGRYLGQKKSNELKGDASYENMFLQVYCCPRCKESFQKKPWVTINDCFKCKLKFR